MRSHADLDASRPSKVALALLLALCAATLVGLAQPVLDLPEKVGHNDNEGWNAFHAAAAIRGENPYPAPEDLISNNYPPLSFYVVGVASVLTSGDTLLAGRWVALLSLLIVAFDVAWITSTLTRSRFAACFAALLGLGSMGAHYQNYVALNDPQMLGQAFQFTGLGWFIAHGDRRRGMLGALLLLGLGGLVKHNLLALPLAVTFWLARKRPIDFRGWMITAVIASAACVGAMALLFGPRVFPAILGHARIYDAHLLPLALVQWFVPVAPLLTGAAALFLLRREDSREDLILFSGVLALLVCLLMSLGTGVNYNAIFDLVFVAAIGGAVVVERICQRPGSQGGLWMRPVAVLALSSTIFLAAPLRADLTAEDFQERTVRRRSAREDLTFVRSQEQDAMCQDAAICYWAGKSYEVDFFNLSQRLAKGRLGGRALCDRLARAEFGVVQLKREGRSDLLDPAIDRAIVEHYEVGHVSAVNGFFYVPRR